MNKRIRISILLVTAILWIGVISCDDRETLIDLTPPTIEVTNPGEGTSISAGDYIVFESVFADDVELATYNIEIHENFGGHGHGRVAQPSDDPGLLQWTFMESFLIPDGQRLFQAVLEDHIAIPNNALAGPYHFIVQAIDKAGNSTSFQDNSAIELEIFITNESQPVVQITNLVNDELEIEKNVLFTVLGEISDPSVGAYSGIRSLDVVLAEDGEHSADHNHGGRITSEAIVDMFYGKEDLQTFMVDEKIILDKVFTQIGFKLTDDLFMELQNEGVDHLILTMSVQDEQGNITVSRSNVHIHVE